MLLTPEQAAEQYAELSKTGKNFHGSLSFNRAKKAATPRSKAVPRPPTVASPAKAPFAAAASSTIAPTGGALSQRRPPSYRATLDAAASQPVLAAAPPPQTLPLAPPPQLQFELPPLHQASAAPIKPAGPPPGALAPVPAAAGSMLGRLSPELDDKLNAAKQQVFQRVRTESSRELAAAHDARLMRPLAAPLPMPDPPLSTAVTRALPSACPLFLPPRVAQAGAAVRTLFGEEEDEGDKGGSPSKDGDDDDEDENDGRPRFLNPDHYKDMLEGFFECTPRPRLVTASLFAASPFAASLFD